MGKLFEWKTGERERLFLSHARSYSLLIRKHTSEFAFSHPGAMADARKAGGKGFPISKQSTPLEGGKGGFFGNARPYTHTCIHAVCTGKGTAFFSPVDISLGRALTAK